MLQYLRYNIVNAEVRGIPSIYPEEPALRGNANTANAEQKKTLELIIVREWLENGHVRTLPNNLID